MRWLGARRLFMPAFPDEDDARIASTLNVTAWVFAVCATLWGASTFFLFESPGVHAGLPVALLAASLASLAWLRRGALRAPSYLLVGAAWVVMTAALVAGGRIDTPGFAGYLVVIVAAGLLLGGHALVAVAGLSVLAGGAIGLAQRLGALPLVGSRHTLLSTWLVESLLFALTAILLYVAAGRMREALARARHEHNFNAAVLDTVGALVVVGDGEGRIVRFNRACERLTGYRAEEVRGRVLWDLLVAPEERKGVKEIFARLRAGEFPLDYENDWVAKDGSRRRIVWSNTALAGERGEVEHVIGTGIDVTARRRLEEELLHSQKMEALGRLAGGIAHDFNNVLLTVGGRAEQLLERIDEADPLHRGLAEIDRAARRGASLTRQLLAFGRRDPLPENAAADLNAAVEEVGEMLRPLIGEHIELAIRPGADLPPVRVDPARLEQVILNLALNARDAMPRGGRLEIETASAAGNGSASNGSARDRVRLSVRDSGAGMDEETRRRAFEPFFTRKEPGKGTGLGLSAVYGIVRHSGGEVRIESAPGAGTAVHVYLLRAQGPPRPAAPERAEPRAPADPGPATLLLVEDDRPAREMLTDYLRLLGFRVLPAESGVQAVELFQRAESGVDAVITDWVMPGMSGPELAERIHSESPSTKLLFVSGYAEQSIAFGRLRSRGAAFLRKPFSLKELVAELHSLIETPAARPRP